MQNNKNIGATHEAREKIVNILEGPELPDAHIEMQVNSDQNTTDSNHANDEIYLSELYMLTYLGLEEFSAAPAQITKEWQHLVIFGLRSYLVKQLVNALFPNPDPSALLDPRIKSLIDYGKKVELDTYETSNSQSEYYHSLAEKIDKIQNEIEKKHRKQKIQQQQLDSTSVNQSEESAFKENLDVSETNCENIKSAIQTIFAKSSQPQLNTVKNHLQTEVMAENVEAHDA